MKKKIFAPLFFLSLSASTFGLTEQYTKSTGDLTDPTIWSTGTAPTFGNTSYLDKSGEYTIGGDINTAVLGTNWGSRQQTVRMVDSNGFEITDPAKFYTFTVDGGSETGTLIRLRSNSGTSTEENRLTFLNGNYVFKTDSSEIKFTTEENTISGDIVSGIVKVVEFGENTVVSAIKNTFISGRNKELYRQSNYVLNGTFNAFDGTSYKQLAVAYTCAEVGGNLNIGKLALWGGSDFRIAASGVVACNNDHVSVEDGAKLTVDGSLSGNSIDIQANSGGFIVSSTGRVNALAFNNRASNSIVEQGGIINAEAVYAYGGLLTINGTVAQSVSENISQNILIDSAAAVKVSSTGKLSAKGGYGNIHIDGVLDISGGKNSVITSGNWGLRIRDGGRLILRSTDAISNSETGEQSNYVFWAYSGNTFIDILADNSFNSFAMVKKSNLTVTIGADVNLVTIRKFISQLDSNCIDGLADETAKLTLVGFKENTIRVLEAPGEADKNADGFLAIYADGWKDFYIDENGYLAATPVPEPAGFSVILGVVSLYCMVRRRRS